MARVPTASGNLVQRDALRLPGLQAVDATQGWREAGQAASSFGGAITQFAEAEDALDAERDEAAVKMLDSEYSDWSREKLFTGEGAFYTQEGFAADTARKTLEQEIEDKRRTLVERTSNGRQAALAQEALRRRVSGDLEGIARYATQQYRVEERRQSEARLASARNDALAYADDPVRFGEELLVGEAEVRAGGRRRGASTEAIDLEVEEFRSGVHRDVISNLIGTGKIDEAIARRDEMRGSMLPDDENKVEQALYRPMFERKIDGLADFVMAGGQPLQPGQDPDPQGSNGSPDNPVVAVPKRAGFAIASPVTGGRITSRYGTRAAPTAGASTNHRAIDIAAPAGSPIVAQSDGRVVSAKPEGGAGNVVRIDYGNGVVYSYAHMQGWDVKPGDVVKAGAQLGKVGQTGTATGPHVHVVARVNGERVDPETFQGEVGGALSQAGAGTAPEARAQKHNLEELLGRIDAMGLPFEEEKALKAEIRNRVGQDEQLRQREQGDAVERAMEIIDKAEAAGGRITRESAIPAEVWESMDPADRMRIRSVIEENAKPTARHTDYAEYTRLSDMFARDPEGFASINPAQYRNKLDDTDYERILGWRRKVLSGGAEAEQISHSRVSTIVGQVRRMVGLTTEGIPTKKSEARQEVYRRIYKLEGAVRREVEIWQRANPGKDVPDDIIQRAAERQLTETRAEGAERPDASDRTYWFERERGQRYTIQIPLKDRERLRRMGRQVLGREPTQDEISEAFFAEARGGY